MGFEKESESYVRYLNQQPSGNNEPALAQQFPVPAYDYTDTIRQKTISAKKGRLLDEMDSIDIHSQDATVITTTTAYLPNASGQVKDYFKSKMSGRGGPNLKVKYNLTLKIQYKTEIGEQLGIVGNIGELGSW